MPSYIHKVHIKNYKSIANASVDLEKLIILIGPNGAGKSNFIDALSFVQQSLEDSIELGFKNRGGIGAVRRKSGGHPTHIGIRLSMVLKDNIFADYAFEIAAKPKEQFQVARERCMIKHVLHGEYSFETKGGVFIKEIPGVRARLAPDRLALFAASATDEFRPVYDFLSSMRFYSIVPARLRELQEPDPGDFLKRDGRNAAAVLKRLREISNGNNKYERICRLLSKVVEGVEKVEYTSVGQKEALKFKQQVGLKDPWTFDALNMSDGTLRILGLLLAVYQQNQSTFIGIEEPESTVHPAVTELIMQVLVDAANERQVVVTTHSPDILDYKYISHEKLRVVKMKKGSTLIAPVIESSREAIKEHLYTPGELLRNDELLPDENAAQELSKQLNLFSRPTFPNR